MTISHRKTHHIRRTIFFLPITSSTINNHHCVNPKPQSHSYNLKFNNWSGFLSKYPLFSEISEKVAVCPLCRCMSSPVLK